MDEATRHRLAMEDAENESTENLVAAAEILASAQGYPEPTEPEPDAEQIEAWVYDSVCDATDGCTVEPDGICEHGHPSWLIRLGFV